MKRISFGASLLLLLSACGLHDNVNGPARDTFYGIWESQTPYPDGSGGSTIIRLELTEKTAKWEYQVTDASAPGCTINTWYLGEWAVYSEETIDAFDPNVKYGALTFKWKEGKRRTTGCVDATANFAITDLTKADLKDSKDWFQDRDYTAYLNSPDSMLIGHYPIQKVVTCAGCDWPF